MRCVECHSNSIGQIVGAYVVFHWQFHALNAITIAYSRRKSLGFTAKKQRISATKI